MFHNVIPVRCDSCQGLGCRDCGNRGFRALDKAPYEGEDKCEICSGYGYVIVGKGVSPYNIPFNDVDECLDCEYSGKKKAVKKQKKFDIGDTIHHLSYGFGVVVEDISNSFAESYLVRYRHATLTSSAHLMMKAELPHGLEMNSPMPINDLIVVNPNKEKAIILRPDTQTTAKCNYTYETPEKQYLVYSRNSELLKELGEVYYPKNKSFVLLTTRKSIREIADLNHVLWIREAGVTEIEEMNKKDAGSIDIGSIIEMPVEELTKELIFKAICDWQMESGESFTDYFDSNIKTRTFMPWALGKEYITPEQFDAWELDYRDVSSDARSINSILYNWSSGKPMSYAVIESEDLDYNDADQDMAFMILAEFISEITVYKKRFMKFMKDYESGEI